MICNKQLYRCAIRTPPWKVAPKFFVQIWHFLIQITDNGKRFWHESGFMYFDHWLVLIRFLDCSVQIISVPCSEINVYIYIRNKYLTLEVCSKGKTTTRDSDLWRITPTSLTIVMRFYNTKLTSDKKTPTAEMKFLSRQENTYFSRSDGSD